MIDLASTCPGLPLQTAPGEETGPVFAEPWQAHAFAMVLQLHQRGFQIVQRDAKFCRQQICQLRQILRQVAVPIQRVDQQASHFPITIIQRTSG